MTNMEAEKEKQCDPRMATLLAVHLVSQVLDEAYVIANAAQDSGQPWQYVTCLRKIKDCALKESYDNDLLGQSLFGDIKKINQTKLPKTPRKIATSTPQKSSGNPVNTNEHSLIGQGDEEVSGETDDSKSTSLLITNIFDMSDVEREMNCSEPALVPNKLEPNDLIITAMKKIMDYFVEIALNSAVGQDVDDTVHHQGDISPVNTTNSSYSFLSDAVPEDNGKEYLSFNINDPLNGTYSKQIHDNILDETENENDRIASYEKSFLTLNRDYEQYSEDEEPVLQDPKGPSFQEVELMPERSSGDNPDVKEMKPQDFAAVSGVSSSGLGSKKSSLVRRCRTQGARLLSCLRGWWWRRKMPGKRRDVRKPGSIRGMCPLSPDARRRAASLLDQRHLRTPSPRSVVWKFNTVNEALVHSTQWKEFTSKMEYNENENC